MPTASGKDSPATSGSGHKATARAISGTATTSSRRGDHRLTTPRRTSRTATSANFQPPPEPAVGRTKLVTSESTAQNMAGRPSPQPLTNRVTRTRNHPHHHDHSRDQRQRPQHPDNQAD